MRIIGGGVAALSITITMIVTIAETLSSPTASGEYYSLHYTIIHFTILCNTITYCTTLRSPRQRQVGIAIDFIKYKV